MRDVFILLICLCSLTSLSAQQDMGFDEALSAMLENNSSVKAQQYGVDAAYNELRATRGLYLPKIDLIGGYTLLQRDVDVELGGAKGVVSESLNGFINKGVSSGLITSELAQLLAEGLSPLTSVDWRYTLQRRSFGMIGATLTMPIYMGGSINIANRVAKLTLDMAMYSLDAVENMLVTSLVERYYGVIVARHVADVRQEVVRVMMQHLSDATAMEEEGVIAHSEVVYVQYKLAEAERDMQEAKNRVKVAESALNALVGQSINPVGRIFLYKQIYSIDYYRDMADILNPILCETKLGKQLSDEGVKLARAALLPEVVAMGAASLYSYQLSDIVPRWSVGIGVRIPLFDGLGKEHRYKAARSEAESVKYEVENARSDIMLLVDKEYYTLQNRLFNIAANERAMALAESYYHSASEGFREGVTSSTELMDACVEVAAAKVKYLNSAYEYCLSLARLLEASGLSGTLINYVAQGEKVFI